MLTTLHIENIALIDALEVEFSQGLNVLTGETGAGKSVIIGSVGIALGGRFDRALLRDPEKEGIVEVCFSLTGEEARRLLESGVLPEDILLGSADTDDPQRIEELELLITRKLTKNRAINRINGETVPIGMLKQAAEQLINLHAQHEQTTLLSPAKHLQLLDSWDDAVRRQRDRVRGLYQEKETIAAELERLDQDPAERAKRADFLQFQIDEIRGAKPVPGEDTELEEEFRRMSHAEEIRDICQEVYLLTSDERGAASQIMHAARRMQELNRLDGESELPGQLSEVESLLSDFNQSLSEYMEDSAYSPEDLQKTGDRLDLLNSLKAKYGRSIEAVLETLESLEKEQEELEQAEGKLLDPSLRLLQLLLSLEKEQEELEQAEGRIEELSVLLEKKKKELQAEAGKLTDMRRKAAGPLEKKVLSALQDMNFSHVEFHISFDTLPEIGQDGQDSVCFMLSTNLGEPAKPLHKVASGGELSRVMLALKATLSDAQDTPTLVFDEIDVGISGITAQKIGNMLKKLAESRQILTITHLPQIAAAGDTAYRIEKKEVGGKTYTGIVQLDEQGREDEIARLLGGDKITDAIRQSARELIHAER